MTLVMSILLCRKQEWGETVATKLEKGGISTHFYVEEVKKEVLEWYIWYYRGKWCKASGSFLKAVKDNVWEDLLSL
jgi:hypothetical protein